MLFEVLLHRTDQVTLEFSDLASSTSLIGSSVVSFVIESDPKKLVQLETR